MSKYILVTGGAGYVGSHICKLLKDKGYNPVIFDNLSTGHKTLAMWGEFIKGDLREFKEINKLLKRVKPKYIIHLAALADIGQSNKNPDLYYSNNIISTINLLKSMRENKIKNILFSSSCSIFGNTKKKNVFETDKKNPESPYAYTKYICENLIRSSSVDKGINYVILRYFNAAGASSSGLIGEKKSTRIIPQIIKTFLNKNKKLIINGTNFDTFDGTCIRDFIHVDDVAMAHLKSIEYLRSKKKNDDFNIGSGKGYSILQLVKIMENYFSKKINIESKKKRFGDAPYLVSSIRKAKINLNWRPSNSSINNIIESAVKWEKTQ